MDKIERIEIALLMHKNAETYVINPDCGLRRLTLNAVKSLISLIERERDSLPSELVPYHDGFLKARDSSSADEFMMRVLSQCCIYGLY